MCDVGKTDRLPADKLIEGLMGLEKLPRLIVLASCESAGKEDPSALNRADSALTALGPRLSDIGVPAVLAMHGSISMATVNLFMPAFFNELSSDGRVDHALSVARNQAQLHDRYDAWMPVLFTRSISGRLWPDPSQTGPTAEQMDSLINEMQSLKDRPAGGINIQGEHISIEGGVNYGAGANQATAPAPVKVEPVETAKTPAKSFYLDLQAVRNSRANVEMDDLLDQPREYMYLRSFVGRSYEYQKFKDLIVTELNRREKRIVAYYGKEGMGKSTLLDAIAAGEIQPIKGCIVCLKKCGKQFCIMDKLVRSQSGDVTDGLVFTGGGVGQDRREAAGVGHGIFVLDLEKLPPNERLAFLNESKQRIISDIKKRDLPAKESTTQAGDK